VNKKYLAGSYSQLYRIVNKYLHKSDSPHHFRKELVTTRSILKSIKKVKDEARAYKNETINRLMSHSEKIILSYLDMFYIDLNGLRTYAQQMLSGEIAMIISKKGRVIDPGDLLLIADGINNFNLNWKKRDAFGERIHTPFTNLFKELRLFIRIVGVDDELVTLDLSNSQPYFSSIAIHPNVIREVIPEFSPCIPLLSHLPQKEDFINYSSLCARGELYLYWGRLRGFSGDDKSVRESGKSEMFTLLFRSNREPKKQIVKDAVDLFKEHFPSVHAAFREIKNLNEKPLPFISSLKSFRNKRGKIALYYKNLSCMMQRIESRIILDRVAPELIKAGITPFVTVHDSFMLPVKYQEQAKEIIEKVFTDLGVNPPNVKRESNKIVFPFTKLS
jgi:hypothetical protein